MLDCCKPLAEVKKEGITLDQVRQHLQADTTVRLINFERQSLTLLGSIDLKDASGFIKIACGIQVFNQANVVMQGELAFRFLSPGLGRLHSQMQWSQQQAYTPF